MSEYVCMFGAHFCTPLPVIRIPINTIKAVEQELYPLEQQQQKESVVV